MPNNKGDIMITLKNKAGRTVRVPIEYAQRAANSGTGKITVPEDPDYGKKFMEEHLERLRKRQQNT